MLPSTTDTDALIHRIHEAALDPARWPEVLRRVVAGCGGCGGVLFTPLHGPVHGGIAFADGVPQATIERWAAFPRDEDPYARAAGVRGLFRDGLVIDGDALVPPAELVRTRFYRDLMAPTGIGRLCSGIVFDSTDANKLPTVISVYRRLSDAPFGPAPLQWLARLVGHLSHALGVLFHLRDRQLRPARSTAALDRLARGVALLDRQGGVRFLNAAAQAQAATGEPWRLERDGGRGPARLALAPRLRAQDAELRRAVAWALDPLAARDPPHFSSALVLPAADSRPACVVHAAPLGTAAAPSAFGLDGAEPLRAIVFFHDLSAAFALQPGMLMGLLDLTAAEARAALQLLRGGSTEAMAWRLDVPPPTFQAQLQAVYDRTQTHRPADLLKLLLALAVR